MKSYKYTVLIVALVLFSLFACEKTDKVNGIWKTGPLKEYQVKPINGGAIITYNVPNDEGLLYIMAEYERNGEVFTEKSSLYGNSISINGFNTTGKVNVKLYKVNKNKEKSEPVLISFKPLKSLVKIAHNSLNFQTVFGGIQAKWNNPHATPLGVHLLYKMKDSGVVTKTDTVYFSSLKQGKHTFRGFDAHKASFAVFFKDKWGNTSDTTFYTTTPFFETLIAKPYGDMRDKIPYDNTSNLYGPGGKYKFANIWNNIVNTSHEGWLTTPGESGVSFTIDLKQRVKVSRIIIWGYHHNAPYTQVNIQKFELWGTDTIYEDKLSNTNYWLDEYSVRHDEIHGIPNTYVLPSETFQDVWQYLGYFAITRYDLMTPVNQQAIINLAENGMEYIMPINAEPVRYLRFYVRQVGNLSPPPSSNYYSMGEISVFGDNTIPQHN